MNFAVFLRFALATCLGDPPARYSSTSFQTGSERLTTPALPEARGRSASVKCAHTLKPLDREAITDTLQRFEHVVVIEDCAPNGNLGMQVKALAYECGATCRLDTFSLEDAFIHCYGSHDDILAAHGLAVADIAKALDLT